MLLGGRGAGSVLTAGPAQVWDTAAALNRTAEPNLQSLERQLATQPEPLRAVQRLQDLLEALLGYTSAIPFWRNPAVSLEALAEQVDLYDWYRCGPALFPASGPPLQAPMLINPRIPKLPAAAPRGSEGSRCLPAPTPPSPCPMAPVLGPHLQCARRWLGYLGLLLLDVAVCLLVLVGLIRSSKGVLVG